MPDQSDRDFTVNTSILKIFYQKKENAILGAKSTAEYSYAKKLHCISVFRHTLFISGKLTVVILAAGRLQICGKINILHGTGICHLHLQQRETA